jgi:NADPH2:quinone reductase
MSRAVVITEFGGPEVLQVQERPDPVPRDHEVLVRVRASGINRADLLQRMGKYPAPAGVPADIPGLEFAGEVVALGPRTTKWRIGQRVFAITGGGAHAELVVSHEDLLAAIPDPLSWEQAAAVPEVFITAHDALSQAGVKAGERVLIHAIGSGVGLAAVQICGALGVIPYGTSRTADKIVRAKEYGLEHGYPTPEPDSLEQLGDWANSITGSTGFNVVLDLNGGPYFPAGLKALGLKGRIVLIGSVAGARAEVDLRQIFGKRLHIIGTVLRARSLEEKAAATAVFAKDVVPLLASGKIKPVIDSVFALEQIAEAHRRLESNVTFGKVVLTL